MMKYSILFLSALAISLFSFNTVKVEIAKVDLEASSVEWKASKVTGKHNGTIDIKEGDLTFTDGILTGGTFTMDMTSIACTDLDGGTASKLEGHLKSADFFGVEEYPTSTLVIKDVFSRGTMGEYKVVADITIKGTTKEIKCNTILKDGAANATIVLDRTDYKVKYGSGSFFSNLGDKTIHDEFTLDVSLAYSM
jgi:polyisoprenoid-binding protein YceI